MSGRGSSRSSGRGGGGRSRGGGGGGRGRSSGGRGGGRGRGRGGSLSAPTTPLRQRDGTPSSSSSSYRARSATPSSKKDGEKGAEAHTVSEEYRIQLTNVLMHLRETDGEESITLPSDLTNTQRKFVHELSKKMGLKSKSHGKGEGRRITVSKVSGAKGGSLMGSIDLNESRKKDRKEGDLPTEEEYKMVPRIHVGKKGLDALRGHMERFPPSQKEMMEGRETGSSMVLEKTWERAADGAAGGDAAGSNAVVGQGAPLLTLDALQAPAQGDQTHEQSPSTGEMEERRARQRAAQKAKHERILLQRKQNHMQSQHNTKCHKQYKQMMKQRTNLPAFAYAKDICNILRDGRNQVVILTGDTGCGKSTQVPQFLLDDPEIGPKCNIIVTQPRRISAISVAERVASERCEPAGQTVGYSVRLEGCSSKHTQLLFCTPGVLMKRLHPDDGGADMAGRLSEYTHIVMDEIHERDKNTEFLMIALQELLEEREDLQLILMSATMPTRDLAEYWCGVGRRRMQTAREEREEERRQSQCDGGGEDHLYSKSQDDDDWGDDGAAMVEESKHRVSVSVTFFLEDVLSMTGFVNKAGGEGADMAQIENDLMSFRVVPSGPKKTSLTIEDVAFVIDIGRAKEKSYDPHLKTSTLQETWISQASAKQRKGRAGRCKAGVAFHLFSRRRHSSMRPFVESELIRTPLEEICLQCKRMKLAPGGPDDPNGIPAFLSKAMTPPHSKSILNALELLVDLGAMDEETNELTDLGVCLSAMSLEPRVGKMVIMSHLIGCAKSSAWMAVAMSSKSPFAIPPPSMRKQSDMAKVQLSEGFESDQITSLNVLRQRDRLAKRGMGQIIGWCRQNFLNFSSLNMISDLRKNVSREVEGLGFPPSAQDSGYQNRHDRGNTRSMAPFLQASICAGLYPNVAYRRQGDVNFNTITNRKAKIHMSSVNAVKSQPMSRKCEVAENQAEFVVFGELVKGKAMFTMDHTTHLVSPLPLLLLCGQLHVRPIEFAPPAAQAAPKALPVITDKNGNPVGMPSRPARRKSIAHAIVSLDDWLVFLSDTEVALWLVVLRKRLDMPF
ncbi:hypothetical protein ACHAXT_007945 [Thalassiosira profunda]